VKRPPLLEKIKKLKVRKMEKVVSSKSFATKERNSEKEKD